MVEVRGRVDGYIEQRLFQIGADVKAGQVLYMLDLRPYQADVAKAQGDLAQSQANLEFAQHQVALLQAEADLAQAQANLLKAQQDVDASATAGEGGRGVAAGSRQRHGRAAGERGQRECPQGERGADAAIDAGADRHYARRKWNRPKRCCARRELNLEYATIRAPISGRIGDSLVQVGGLVTRTSATAADDDRAAGPDLGALQGERGGISERIRSRERGARCCSCRLNWCWRTARVHPYHGHIENTRESGGSEDGNAGIAGDISESAAQYFAGSVRPRAAEDQ